MKSKMINIKDFDFQDLLDSASNLYDVEFKIIDENSQELGTVRSQKYLLSILSPVLKKMFSSREEGAIVVEITGPSFISFQTLIQFLYTGDESIITGQLNHPSLVSRPVLIHWRWGSYYRTVEPLTLYLDLYIQMYPPLIIFLIFMFWCILYW